MPARKKTVTTTEPAAARRQPRTKALVTFPTPDEIAARAYLLFLERGGTHGYDQDDWLTAERELSVTAATGSHTV